MTGVGSKSEAVYSHPRHWRPKSQDKEPKREIVVCICMRPTRLHPQNGVRVMVFGQKQLNSDLIVTKYTHPHVSVVQAEMRLHSLMACRRYKSQLSYFSPRKIWASLTLRIGTDIKI